MVTRKLLLMKWNHQASPMMKAITELREKYDLHMSVERFISDEYKEDMKYIRN